MARKKKVHDHHGGGGGGHGGASGRWLVSYADFITLMFVVFLVLFSMARLDVAKYGTLARSLNQALGPVGPDIPPLPARGQLGTALPVVAPERPGNLPDLPDWPAHLVAPPPEEPIERDTIPPADPPPPTAKLDTKPSQVVTAPPPAPPDAMQGLADAFKGMSGAKSGLLAVALEERGLVVTIAGSLLFDPGQVKLKPEAGAYLNEVAQKLRGVELPVMVSGTPDGLNASNTEMPPHRLAALRTSAVIDYFVTVTSLPAQNFVFFGSAEQRGGDGGRVSIIVLRKQN